MTWNPQRLAPTGTVSHPMPGPGDLWGSPEDDFVSACANDCPYCDTCSDKDRSRCFVEDYEECEVYAARHEEDLDELINFAGPYAVAPPNNDLSLHDDHLHPAGVYLRVPWWRYRHRAYFKMHPREDWPFGVISVTAAVSPCTPDDREAGEGELADTGASVFWPTPSSVVFEGWWRHRALYHLNRPGAANTKHWRRRNIKGCQPTESGLTIGGVWSRP